ncbi:S49 family peptidase, partial [Treponema paraluiscuniculi]
SGAYWVASAADYIFASPYTITGSIGVLSVLPTFETFLERYAGITVDSVQVHGVRQPSLLRSGTAEDTARMQLDVMATYRTFLSVVSAG